MKPDNLRAWRISRRETQAKFWGRLGVAQTRGSRYELNSVTIPLPIEIILQLFALGRITESDLKLAKRTIRRQSVIKPS